VDPSLVVISADQCNMTRDTFKRESDPAFIEAKREQEREVRTDLDSEPEPANPLLLLMLSVRPSRSPCAFRRSSGR
jgi:hypothetical protein